MSTSQIQKLKRYIKDDRPSKLRSFVRKHKISLEETKLKSGRNLLHYCCKNGSGTVLKYLIREDVDGMKKDEKGNLPLHLALQRALLNERSFQHNTATDCYTDLILPMIERFPKSLDEYNSAGESCRSLLQKLVRCRQRKHSESSSSSSSSGASFDAKTDDVRWRDKLAAEYQDEYFETVGRYQQDFEDYSNQQETYDDWAERIRSQYYERKRSRSQAYVSRERSKKSKTDHKPKTQAGPENLEDIRSKMRERFKDNSKEEAVLKILKRRIKYERKYKEVLERKENTDLSYGDIPWPNLDSDSCDDLTVLFEGLDREGSDFKKYYKDQQIRWHPDKFAQRFGDCLKLDDKGRIMGRVTQLSQNINRFLSS